MSTTLTRQKPWGIAKETTPGVAIATATTWIPYDQFEPVIKTEYAVDKQAIGRVEGIRDKEIAFVGYEASFECILSTDELGHFLLYGFGIDTPVTTLGATTHTFSTQQLAQLPTFTSFYQEATTDWFALGGCTINQLTIDIPSQGDYVKVSGDFMAINRAPASVQTPVFTLTDRKLMGKHTTCGYATTLAGLSSPTPFEVQSCKIMINNNLVQNKAVSSVNAVEIIKGDFSAQAEFSIIAKSTFWGTSSETGVKRAFQINMVNTNAAVIGTSTLKPALKIEIPPSVFETTHKRPLDVRVEADIKLDAVFDASASLSTRFTLINATTTY